MEQRKKLSWDELLGWSFSISASIMLYALAAELVNVVLRGIVK